MSNPCSNFIPYTLEVTGKGIHEVEQARAVIPAGTPINIAFLGNEDHAQRIQAAKVIRACGAEPVPIISSRRLCSEADRDELIGALVAQAAPKRFMFVGGDPATPAGLGDRQLGRIGWHRYPFGGIEDGVTWINARLSADTACQASPR